MLKLLVLLVGIPLVIIFLQELFRETCVQLTHQRLEKIAKTSLLSEIEYVYRCERIVLHVIPFEIVSFLVHQPIGCIKAHRVLKQYTLLTSIPALVRYFWETR